ncbi:hypothetical protein JCM19237_5075 [Photobacterium aphoticum]|uniref:Uncharacterized protein n=1 Tax=Photobacterium aphoticum TaxID=754436 RepID=A0A090R3F0_9GAMM|nr:hypothetical protein JCM19237_5075 [Photobacterium aphoticum]
MKPAIKAPSFVTGTPCGNVVLTFRHSTQQIIKVEMRGCMSVVG